MSPPDDAYVSAECHLREHEDCEHGPPRPREDGVIYQACTCDCHYRLTWEVER